MPDGSFECVVYAEDKYFEDGSGNRNGVYYLLRYAYSCL